MRLHSDDRNAFQCRSSRCSLVSVGDRVLLMFLVPELCLARVRRVDRSPSIVRISGVFLLLMSSIPTHHLSHKTSNSTDPPRPQNHADLEIRSNVPSVPPRPTQTVPLIGIVRQHATKALYDTSPAAAAMVTGAGDTPSDSDFRGNDGTRKEDGAVVVIVAKPFLKPRRVARERRPFVIAIPSFVAAVHCVWRELPFVVAVAVAHTQTNQE
jgi:hypothetical protein